MCLPDVHNLQTVLDFLWQVLDVLAVLSGQKDSFDAGSEGANELLLDSADGGDAPAKRDFAL